MKINRHEPMVSDGRPRRSVDIAEIKHLADQGKSTRQIAELLGVSSATVVRRLQEIRENTEAKRAHREAMLLTSLRGIELSESQKSLLYFMSRQNEDYVEALASLILKARQQGFKS